MSGQLKRMGGGEEGAGGKGGGVKLKFRVLTKTHFDLFLTHSLLPA